MDKFVYFLIPLGLAATAVVLGLGVWSMAKGGAFAKENSNKLMRLRVLAQGVTIILILLFLLLIGRGPNN